MTFLDENPPDLRAGFRPVRLDTLVRLRWLAVAGQSVAVVVVALVLYYPTPLAACLGLIGLSILLNLWLIARFAPSFRPSVAFATAQLGFDCLQLGGLLALTGGLENPFALLLLAPVSVSATSLPQRATFTLAGLVIAMASALALYHLPLPWNPQNVLIFDQLYIVAIWLSLTFGVLFVATYTNRVAHEARQLSDALAATELALSRHEQLSALDGLAAAAAHELGTPLSTIALAAKEMLDELPPGPLRDDVDLIISQSARCRAILAKLRNLGAEGGDPFASVPLKDLLAEVAQPYQGDHAVVIETGKTVGPDPVVHRTVGLLYGLGNLIENAADFARTTVRVAADWDRSTVTVAITDDGPGFPVDLLDRLGEPYLTTRADQTEGRGGLGLGIFIAKTLLERTGARLLFENEGPEGSARVNIVWPRERIEQA